jgi:hypothetical protein
MAMGDYHLRRPQIAPASTKFETAYQQVRMMLQYLQAAICEQSRAKLRYFLAEAALRADPVAIADDQHPDHPFRIDRRPSGRAVEAGKV